MKNSIRKLFSKAKEEIPFPSNKPEWKFDTNDPRRFFFMHIPKTAGTTFRKILENHAPKGHVWPDQNFLKTSGKKYPSEKILLEKYRTEMASPIFLGHYNLDILQHLSKDIIVITFLRNPYERVLSHIKHEVKVQKNIVDPNDVVENKLNKILYTQSHMFRFKPTNQIGLKNMKKNIGRINFIGITEEFDRSIDLCNRMFEWNLEKIEPQNQIDDSILDQLSSKNRSKIITNLIPEIRTYRNALQKFNQLCAKYKV